jgi:hypothetical protein
VLFVNGVDSPLYQDFSKQKKPLSEMNPKEALYQKPKSVRTHLFPKSLQIRDRM